MSLMGRDGPSAASASVSRPSGDIQLLARRQRLRQLRDRSSSQKESWPRDDRRGGRQREPRAARSPDLTIVYLDGAPSFWQFLRGDVTRVVARADQRPIPHEVLQGDPMADAHDRLKVQRWVLEL
jgi:hypothetical protein